MSKGITGERNGYLLQSLFAVLLESPNGIRGREALSQLAGRVEMTEHEQGSYESGSRFEKIVRFATVTAVKSSWMRKDKGVWYITEKGATALSNVPDPGEFYASAFSLYRQWQKEQEDQSSGDETDVLSDGDSSAETRVNLELAEEQVNDEVNEYLTKLDPYKVQDLVAALLEAMDYHVVYNAPPEPDGGIDIIAFTDPLGTSSPRIKVQIKRRRDNIGEEELRAFLSLINGWIGISWICM